MKPLKELMKISNEKKSYLKEKNNVRSLSVFGSYSRAEAISVSDIDFLVEFEEPIGLEFVDLADELEEMLQIDVDLVSKNGVNPSYLKVIEKDLVHV